MYAYQPGALNEGMSDIIGATMEYYLNDSNDKPDFTLGENLIGGGQLEGFILRFMESPKQDGKSIDNVCEFNNDMNVHYSSGVPNKAFTSSVRACQNSGCGNERECVLLMGPLYMYANIHGLTQLSGYLDAASATCSLGPEYMARGTTSTTCSTAQAVQFVKQGWAAVGVTLAVDCTASTTSGCVLPDTPANGLGGCLGFIVGGLTSAYMLVNGALEATVEFILGPFLD